MTETDVLLASKLELNITRDKDCKLAMAKHLLHLI